MSVDATVTVIVSIFIGLLGAIATIVGAYIQRQVPSSTERNKGSSVGVPQPRDPFTGNGPGDERYFRRARVGLAISRAILRIIGLSFLGVFGAAGWELVLEWAGWNRPFHIEALSIAFGVGVGASVIGGVWFAFLSIFGIYVIPDLFCDFTPRQEEEDEISDSPFLKMIVRLFHWMSIPISYFSLGFFCGVGIGVFAGITHGIISPIQHAELLGGIGGGFLGLLLTFNLLLGIGLKGYFASWAALGPLPYRAYFLPFSWARSWYSDMSPRVVGRKLKAAETPSRLSGTSEASSTVTAGQ
jgi:hypothetical protein